LLHQYSKENANISFFSSDISSVVAQKVHDATHADGTYIVFTM